jgi:hypothetical protein
VNVGIYEYLGQSLNIPENSQLSHFFNVLSQLMPEAITKSDHKSAVCLGKKTDLKGIQFSSKFPQLFKMYAMVSKQLKLV